MLTVEQEDLWSEVEYLARLCNRRLPKGDPIRELLNDATLDSEPADGPERIADLEKAREAFYAMPPLVLANVLNGWAAQKRRETRAELLKRFELDGVQRVLSIMGGRSTPIYPSGICSCHEFEFSSWMGVARVVIQEGAGLSEVLNSLDHIRGVIQRDWESLIQGTATPPPSEDQGQPPSAVAENEGMPMRPERAA